MIKSRLGKKLSGARRRGGSGGGSGHGMPAMVPMIDMLVILVVYMLVHTADYEIVPNSKNISIPQSTSEVRPHESTVMMITKDMVFVDGQEAVAVRDITADNVKATDRLKSMLAEATHRKALVHPGDDSAREITMMADKALPYSVLKQIMSTAAAADVGKMSLAVNAKERSYSGQSPE